MNSINRDGTQSGYDLELVGRVSGAVSIPVVAVGGAGNLTHFREAVDHGASAVGAGSLFVFHGKHRAVLITYPERRISRSFSRECRCRRAPLVRCARCTMDTIADPASSSTSMGSAIHCRRYDQLHSSRVAAGETGRRALAEIVEAIKREGRGREYDCIIGVSGGVDSTYVAYLVRELGLRALAVHFDNGWNSELAVKNIEHVLKKLGIDLFTYVVDWHEFRDLQVAFLKASTPDGEIPTDHAINALLWREASRRRIRYIISGMNFATESISIPDWAYGHSDWRYIRDVHRRIRHDAACGPIRTSAALPVLRERSCAACARFRSSTTWITGRTRR